jgi:FSR family fosmidomycin resistance protein-like MFS transporter
MAFVSRPAFAAMNAADMRVIGSVGLAHFVSHFNIMILPPLFAIVRADFDVSYTELGLAFVVFNTVSAVLQVPVGFLVDRVGARTVLIAGLVLEAVAFTVIGLVPTFSVFIAMHVLAGLGNTAFHPADYAFLSKRVSHQNIGFAFSFHTFAGMMGMAAGPAATLAFYAVAGWRGAFIGMMSLAWISAIVLLFERDDTVHGQTAGRKETGSGAFRLLASPPIMINFMFFLLLALVSYGITNYLVVTLQALHGTDFALANTALSTFLLMSAAGVMIAGIYVDRIRRHARFAAAGITAFAAGAFVLGLIDLGAVALVATAGFIGFVSGAVYPSRDMLVREVTPPGEFGKVFGFVTTGFNIAGILAPLIYGPLLDHGNPRVVFFAVGGGGLLTVLMVGWVRRSVPR